MKIIALVENYSVGHLKAKHGLSLYIETKHHKILFDLGPDKTLFSNAAKLNIDLTEIDTVIISHGHLDHGGALADFLKINSTAKIFVQRTAFDKYYTKFGPFKIDVGLDKTIMTHSQIILLDGNYQIDQELELFTVNTNDDFYSPINNAMFTAFGKDVFLHEQNLIIHGQTDTLILGCGHKGIVNILENAKQYNIKLCVGGYHLFNPITKMSVSTKLLDKIANELRKYEIEFYTCHCTGKKAYHYLANQLKNVHYLACGEMI
jgi:Metal-dependent hydrolases of the beta-lactamase superfamily II